MPVSAGILRYGRHRNWSGAERDPIPKLAPIVAPPTIGDASGREAARVLETRADRGKSEPAGDGDGHRTVGYCPVAERAEAVVAPAVRVVRRARGCEAAAVTLPRAHRSK